KGGRKPMHLYIETRRRCALAVDISASRTSILVTDLLGHPLMEVFESPTGRVPRALIKELVDHIRRIRKANPEFGECVGVGVSVSGMVDLKTSRLAFSPTLGWRDVEVTAALNVVTRAQ